jgi:hypothetical protein
MLLKVAFVILAALAASCSAVYAQNVNDIMRLLGGMAQNAIAQAAYSQWQKLPQNELACIDQYLRQRGTNLQTAIQLGINPSDKRVADARQLCSPSLSRTTMAGTASPTFDCSSVTYPDERAICDNAGLAQLDHAVVAGYEFVREKFGDQYAKAINGPLFEARRACGDNAPCIRERQLAAIQKFRSLGAPTLWDHNGSTVYLVAKGRSRKFFYNEPREGLLAAGARPDSLVFSGEAVGEQYRGTAYIFNSRCGRLPYPVSGPILENYRRVELQGRAPRVDSNCRTIDYVDDLLVFQLIEPSSTDEPKIAATSPSDPVTTDAPQTGGAKNKEVAPPSKEAVLADIRSVEKLIETRLSELQNKNARQKVEDTEARLATANIDMSVSELQKLQADGKTVTEIFEEADEFKRVSHIADDRLAAINASLESITSDAPITLQLKSAMNDVKQAQKEFALRQLQVALKKLNDLYDGNRKLLKSMEFDSP